MKEGKNNLSFSDDAGITTEINYYLKDDIIQITAVVTRVDQRGKGLAGLIMDEFIKLVKDTDYKVIPMCSYAQYYYDKHPEYQYMLYKEN